MIPNEGLQTKMHGAKPTEISKSSTTAAKEESKEATLQWGPQTRTSIKKQKNP